MTAPDPQELRTTANRLPRDETDESPPAPGSRFGGYLLIEVIGKGGMGIVYKARQEAVDRLVALKIMRNRQSGAEEVKRFTNEARAIARLVHPRIVRIHDVGQVGKWHYLACELIHGTGLDQIVAGQPMAPDRALEIVALLAEALDYAHQKGVIHRDLKPSNVLIDPKGVPHLTDFGLARRLDAESGRLTQTGEVVGTPAYMSPEQISEEFGPIAGTTDVHGLGTILYELLTGRPPFRGENMLNTLHQVLYKLPIAPHALCPEVPPSHGELCLKCLAKKPGERHPNARAVAIHCRGLLAGLVPSPPPAKDPPADAPCPIQPSDRLRAMSPAHPSASLSSLRPLLTLLCLLAAGNAIYLISMRRQDGPDVAAAPPKSQPQAQPDLIPLYIRALERDDQAAAFEVLGRHLIEHPRDWKRRSKRIQLGRQLKRVLDVLPDLQALDAAGKLLSQETEMLMAIYLNQKQQKQAGELMQRIVQRNPQLALRLAHDRARQHLDAGEPFAAARLWLQTPSGTDPGSLFLRTLDRDLRDRLANRGRRRPADLSKLMLDLAKRDPRFFHWPSLVVWLAADPRRVEPLDLKLLERVLDASCRDHKWDVIGRQAGKTLRTRHLARAKQLAERAMREADRAYEDDRYGKAEQQLTCVLALAPLDVMAWGKRSKASWYLGKETQALADCTEALRLQADQPRLLHWRAWMFRDRGHDS